MSNLKPGDLLDGRYRIGTTIAHGGMSTVYASVDTRLDREVAVKVMDASLAHDRMFRTRFEREARAVAKLSHPALVNVFDQGVDCVFSPDAPSEPADEQVFLVMELVHGGSLRELLRERGPMPPHAVVAVMKPVLTALAVAHASGMIHRDIKPDNVLLGSDHQVKLTDFGLVRAIGSSTDTSHGQVIGTAAYLSPEQVQGLSLTYASDVYSAGVLMFELITGRPPFQEDSPISTATARVHQDVPPPSHFVDGVPQEFDDIVATACHRDPEQRYIDGQEFLEDLHTVADQLAIPDFTVPLPRYSKVAQALSGADFGERKAWDDESMATRTVDIPQDDPGAVAGTQDQTRQLGAHPQGFDPQGDAYERYETRQWVQPASQQPVAPPAAGPQLPGGATGQPVAQPPVPAGSTGAKPAPKPLSNRSALRTIVWIIVIVALVAAIATGSWWLSSGRYGEVPSVLGMDQVAASEAIAHADFSSTITQQYSNDVPAGTVIGTEPPFGQRALRGSAVVVLVSLGQPKVPQPSTTDTAASYSATLREATLEALVADEEFSDTVPAGDIIGVEPAAGTTVPVNSQVTIRVSKGPRPIDVPELQGSTRAQAEKRITGLGLRVARVVEADVDNSDSSVRPGRVIRTDPPAGTQLSKGDEVTIVVAAQVTVPLVFGMSGTAAREKLEAAGLQVNIEGRADGVVYTQSPGPTSKVARGTSVTIKTL